MGYVHGEWAPLSSTILIASQALLEAFQAADEDHPGHTVKHTVNTGHLIE